jgi:MFS family permease
MLFIVLMGIVSMFSDMTHEGAASIIGAYLLLAGASGAAIGFVSGLGEFIGYSLRLVTGVIADKTHRYWELTIIGYVIDCVGIPLLALVPEGGWYWACLLIVVQRMGKAIKKPSKDTILSFAASREGAGKSFAIQEALDQIGAFLGPVMLFVVLALQAGTGTYAAYTVCFAILGIPAFATVALLLYAKHKFPDPEKFEPEAKDVPPKFVMQRSFIIYMIGAGLFAMGFVDFSMITMHATRTALVATEYLPLLYALAMLIDAFSALFFGWLYDKYGIGVLAASTLLSAFFAIPVFIWGGFWPTVIGIMMWGVGMGAQESTLKAVVTNIIPKNMRSTGFGIFQTSFGICWFIGSWAMGIMYDADIAWMVAFSVATQLLAVPLFLLTAKQRTKETGPQAPAAQA